MIQCKKGLFTRNLMATAILAPLMIVAGCSSSSGSDNDGPSGSVSSGVAYDGYLVGATVCVDRNLNKACDSGEPSTETTAGGKFNIVVFEEEDILKPLVLEADEDTIDEDTGETVDPGLQYSAPAGSSAVSALSTIIQSKVEQLIASNAIGTLEELKRQANEELADDLGLDGKDLTSYDPIAVSKSGTASAADKEAAAKTHLINQVVTKQLVQISAASKAVSGFDNAASYVAAVRAVEASLRNVVSAVAKYDVTDSSTNLDTIITEIGSAGAPVAPTAEEIQAIAEEYEEVVKNIEEKVKEEVNDEPTGGTGGTGATGGSGS